MADGRSLRERLGEPALVHVDARVLAFHLLGTERHLAATRALFAALRDGAFQGQASAYSLYQLLAEPYRREAEGRVDDVVRRLTVSPGLEWVPVTPDIAGAAAQVRARLGGPAGRAVQIATALEREADVFLTEGSGLRRIAGTAVVNLGDVGELAGRPSAEKGA